MSAAISPAVIVEDCLPRYQQFVSSKRETSGEAITPVLVQAGSPVDSQLTCAADQTYVRWDLGPIAVNTASIRSSTPSRSSAPSATGLYTNTTVVSSPVDPSP
ncbi:hypothetical protein [Variovorax sp. PBS-H4]|uniref:hypothetical protein n=1 Tax=Variovorax sp. PBS-H4 TaxID=434008 RepID=UPI0013A56171|nr:hypothetical protein [Variovorax sp. PBS-H4]